MAVNTAPPAFAAEPSVAAALLLATGLRQSCCSAVATGQTDRRTDGQTQCRYIEPAPHVMQAVPINIELFCSQNVSSIWTRKKRGTAASGDSSTH